MKIKTINDIKITDLNGNVYDVCDVRSSNFYLTKKEKNDWNNRNILYNTLWFYLNKSTETPEVEYADEVISIYKQFSPFEKWDIVYHAGGKVFDPPCNHMGKGRFVADIMTGWWIPFKFFINLPNTSSKKESIVKLIDSLEKSNLVEKNIKLSDLLGWFQKYNSAITENQLIAFLKFLSVIYSVGNIIPAPENPGQGGGRGGPGLDTWQHKLCHRINCANGASDNWNTYITTCYNLDNTKSNWVNFVESNFLTMYFTNSDYTKSVVFWPTNKNLNRNSGNNATLEDWEIYFKNATQHIIDRNKKIYDAIPKGDE